MGLKDLFKSKSKNVEEPNYDLSIDPVEEQKIIGVRTTKDAQIVKYEGKNEEIFEKYSVDNLRSDAQVVVPSTHNAILINDGVLMNTLDSGRYDIFQQNKKGKSNEVATVDVIFVSKTARLRVLWGTRTRFNFRDEETGVPLKVGAHGEFEVGVSSPRKFYLELVGADRQFSIDSLKERLSMRVLNNIEPVIAKVMRENNLTYDRMTEHKKEIGDAIAPTVNKMFEEDYGLKIYSFTLAEVLIDDADIEKIENARAKMEEKAEAKENYQEMKSLMNDQENTKTVRYEKYLDTVKAVGHFEGEGPSGKPQAARKAQGQVECPNCHQAVAAGAKFCPNCGQAMNVKLECPQCHAEVTANQKFCSVCGAKLK